jgi:aspartate racemase
LRKLGIIGGMTWSSTALYYDHINREIARRLGGLHSGRIAIESFDFDEIAAQEDSGHWREPRKGRPQPRSWRRRGDRHRL